MSAVVAVLAVGCACDDDKGQCSMASDCKGRAWQHPNCEEEEGHWECTLDMCAEVCNAECVTESGCEHLDWPDDADCDAADGHWICDDGDCVARCEPPECSAPADCDDQDWPDDANCDAADGQWACVDGACVAVCEPECVVYQDCADTTWPLVEEVDCYEDQGHWECDAGTCVAVCNLECDLDDECRDFSWQEDCVGNWDCVQGLCEPACDPDGCSDGTCDSDGGETQASCPEDCLAQCSTPSDCVDAGEWYDACDGRWTCEAGTCTPLCDYSSCGDASCDSAIGEDAVSCVPDCLDTCQGPTDCTRGTWSQICQGRFTCLLGDCQQTCDSDGCGNGTCDAALGETADSCFSDCLGGPCEAVTDCLGVRWYDSNCPEGGHWECRQPAGACEAICEDDTCGDGICDVLAGEAATGCPADCQGYDCNLTEDCDPLPLPDGCDAWTCVRRNCTPVCS